MGYSESEFWHDFKEVNTAYDTGKIDFKQRMEKLGYFLSVLEKIDRDKAHSIRKTIGL